jgi:hypothetical protein
MQDHFSDRDPMHEPSSAPSSDEPIVVPVIAADGARFDLLCAVPARPWQQLLYWLPAMGVPARHYLPMAQALAARGIGR